MGTGVAVTLTAKVTAGLLALTLLGGCGSDKGAQTPLMAAVGAVAKSTVARVQARRVGGAAAPAPMTRADIEKFNMPILRAVIPARGADALLTISDVKGDVVTWATTDGSTFTLRDNVLIQTRGLGPDLMSAEAPSVAQLSTPGGTHRRLYFGLGANDQTTQRVYDCTIAPAGDETITIFERQHKVTKFTETCSRPQGTITNEFWIEGQDIRKSKQFASALTGYITFERVVD
jgi:Group 4 capsule polysaccharide lipoprotein gfcB, YjbF